MNYGYEGRVLLPIRSTSPPTPRPGQTVTLKAAVSFLVCAEVCVPEDDALSLDLPVTAGTAPSDPAWGRPIAAALAAAPKPAGPDAVFQRGPGAGARRAGAPLRGDAPTPTSIPTTARSSTTPSRRPSSSGPDGLTLTLTPATPSSRGKPARSAGVLRWATRPMR